MRCLASEVNFIPGDGANRRRTGPARFLRLSVSSMCMHIYGAAGSALHSGGHSCAHRPAADIGGGGVRPLYARISKTRMASADNGVILAIFVCSHI